jgi:hypothetical protein
MAESQSSISDLASLLVLMARISGETDLAARLRPWVRASRKALEEIADESGLEEAAEGSEEPDLGDDTDIPVEPEGIE